MDKEMKVIMIPHSHSDLSWGGTFFQCEVMNMEALDSVVEYFETSPGFKFTSEHIQAIKRYLELMPKEKKNRLIKYIKEKRLDVSALYHGTEENFPGPEALARNFLFGKKWLLDNLGVESNFAWSMDTPGHTAQMPQLFSKAGVSFYIISGGAEGQKLFRWKAPDGSSITVFSMGGYTWSSILGFRESLEKVRERFPVFIKQVRKKGGKIILIDDGSDWSRIDPRTEKVVKQWNAANSPKIKITNTTEFIEGLEKEQEKEQIEEFTGEMPTSWVFTPAGVPQTYYWIRYGEHSLRGAENLLVFAHISTGRTFDYPRDILAEAWEKLILRVEHNWFGLNGEITENEREKELAKVYYTGQDLLAYATEEITERIKFGEDLKKVRPIVVFNPTLYSRKDYVKVRVGGFSQMKEEKKGRGILERGVKVYSLKDWQGNYVEYEILKELKGESGELEGYEIGFVAEDIPPLGYKTYYLSQDKRWKRKVDIQTSSRSMENEFLSILFDSTGRMKKIIERKTNTNVVKEGFFDIVALEDRNVDLEEWLSGEKLTEEYETLSIKSTIVNAQALVSSHIKDVARIRKKFTLYQNCPFLDVELTIDWLGKDYEQLRTMMPFSFKGERWYEVPFYRVCYPEKLPMWMPYGEAWRGAKVWEWFRWPDIKVLEKKRQVQNWLMLKGGKSTVLLVTSHSVFHFEDDSCTVEHVLVENKYSCGDPRVFQNDRPRTFNFYYRLFAGENFFPEKEGQCFHMPLRAVGGWRDEFSSNDKEHKILLEEKSFLTSLSRGFVITAFKGAEDGNGYILRGYQTDDESKVLLEWGLPVKEVKEVDLLERSLPHSRNIEVRDKVMSFSVKKWEIISLRINLGT
ncbi:hypothetical protein J7M02_07745 [Candidatus Aerophobetes bacterium]|nr:hypothetical protein [Candidatus Aerophobetes bacterium]